MILFISHYGGRTGAPIALLHLLRWLRANTKHEMRVLVKGDGPLVKAFGSVAETAIAGRAPNRMGRLANRLQNRVKPGSVPALPAAWRRMPIDLIYSNTVTNGALVSTLSRPGVPVITHVHEMSHWIEKSGAANWQRVLGQTSRFIAASQAVKDHLLDGLKVPAERVEVVHSFTPSVKMIEKQDGVRKQFGIPEHAFIVGGSGSESWRKGRDLFVQLAAAVQRLLPAVEVHFIWVGYTGDAEDQRRINHDSKMAGVSGKVHWTGEVADPERYFPEFDVFALVSREDPFPLVCLEAALQGKPSLCFAGGGGMPELIEEDAGIVVPYLDVQAMAGHVVELVKNPALRMKLGKRARAKVLERHTVEQAGPMILKVIERELKHSRRPLH